LWFKTGTIVINNFEKYADGVDEKVLAAAPVADGYLYVQQEQG